MLGFLWDLASFIIALGVLITVHEYGHFWVARRCGVKVERFSIGFGKTLWRTIDKQGTEFVIALIPLGGYVKMLDERVDNVAEVDKDKTFNGKSVYQRIAIIAAGPLANFVFAIFAFYLMFIIGVPNIKPIIGDLKVGSIAAKAGIKSGSEIIALNNHDTATWQDINMALITQIGKPSIELKVKLPKSQLIKTYKLNTRYWNYSLANASSNKKSALSSIGLLPFLPKVHTEIAYVEKNSPAEKAGLKVGDKLLSIAKQPIKDKWKIFSEKIKQYPEKNVSLAVLRENKVIQLTVKPVSRDIKGVKVGYLGVSPKQDAYPKQYRIDLRYGPVDALVHSADKTWQLISLSFNMIGKLITGEVSVKNLSGPIAIAQGAGASAGYGFVYFLGFLALISVNLGFINLLPVPVLDGGHLLYYFIELIIRKPVPEHIQEIGFKFGALALLSLMSIAIYNDLLRL